MASPPSGSGIPTCGSGNSTCGGYSRGTWDCCYDPAGLAANPGGHGNTSWPVVSYVWAYDAGNPDGSNTTGNNVPSMPSTASGYTGNTTRNNLTAVKLGYVNPWDLYPYATWQLNDPFNAAANKAQSGYQTSGTYDPVSGKLYVSLQNAQSTLPDYRGVSDNSSRNHTGHNNGIRRFQRQYQPVRIGSNKQREQSGVHDCAQCRLLTLCWRKLRRHILRQHFYDRSHNGELYSYCHFYSNSAACRSVSAKLTGGEQKKQ